MEKQDVSESDNLALHSTGPWTSMLTCHTLACTGFDAAASICSLAERGLQHFSGDF
jgi:hypothetical protein